MQRKTLIPRKKFIARDPRAPAQAAHLHYMTGEGPGIHSKRPGKGFSYVGPGLKPVHDKATLDRITSLVIPPAWENVWICPFENGHIQALGRDAREPKQYRYHARYREVRDQTKFDRRIAFGGALPKIRQQLDRDLSLSGLPQRKVVAAIVRLLDETCIRIGNEHSRCGFEQGRGTPRSRTSRLATGEIASCGESARRLANYPLCDISSAQPG
jgi:DNA topoisomerase-1